MKARADHHVRFAVDDRLNEISYRGSGISAITIHHDIHVGFDPSEHRSDDVSFSLSPLIHDLRAGTPDLVDGAVGRVVVEDVDCRSRQLFPEIVNDTADCQSFIAAWN